MKNLINKIGTKLLNTLFPYKWERSAPPYTFSEESFWDSIMRRDQIHEWSDKGRMDINEYPITRK